MKLYSIYTPPQKEGEYTIGGYVRAKTNGTSNTILAVADIIIAKRVSELAGLGSYPCALEETPWEREDNITLDKLEVFLIENSDDYDYYWNNYKRNMDPSWINRFLATVSFSKGEWTKI